MKMDQSKAVATLVTLKMLIPKNNSNSVANEEELETVEDTLKLLVR